MKDEVRGNIINEFVGLKSKMYSLVMVDDEEIKKTKDINKNIVESNWRCKEYDDLLFGRVYLMAHSIKRIQNKFHRIGTSDVCKASRSCFDDKRYIFDNGINSFAYFHGNILNEYSIWSEGTRKNDALILPVF